MTTLTAIIYGEPGGGKTPVALTVPGPTLLLDAEGGAEFVPGRKVIWHPRLSAPPDAGDWDVCVAPVRDWQTMTAAAEYIRAGRHPFRSVVLDSVTQLQARCRRNLIAENSRTGRSTEQIWGFLLDDMEELLRDLIDSKTHATNPTTCVVMTAHAVEKSRQIRPDVQGALVRKLPGMVDVVGYLYTEAVDGVPSADPAARRLLVAPTQDFVAKDRTSSLANGGISGVFGSILEGPLNLEKIREAIYREEQTP